MQKKLIVLIIFKSNLILFKITVINFLSLNKNNYKRRDILNKIEENFCKFYTSLILLITQTHQISTYSKNKIKHKIIEKLRKNK